MSGIAPIVGRLRKGLVMDLSVALGVGLSTSPLPLKIFNANNYPSPVALGSWFWYGT
jgi:hypothetical protein